jgi:hypothetical protein
VRGCDKGLVNCPYLDCSMEIYINGVEDHVKICHEDAVFTKAHTRLIPRLKVLETYFSAPQTFAVIQYRLNNIEFYSNVIRKTDGTWLFWVYVAGWPSVADMYTYTVIAQHPNERIGKNSFTGRVVSLKVPKKTIREECNGLAISDKIVKDLVVNGSLHYSIEINELSTETE